MDQVRHIEVPDALVDTGAVMLSLPKRMIAELENQMKAAAKELQFERAAMLRDQIYELRAVLSEDESIPPWQRARLLAGEV